MRLGLALGFAALLAMAAIGCGDDSAPSGTDGGRDTGTTGMCGDIGAACCAGAMRCQTGSVCGPDRSCCGVPGGAVCTRASDCCGTLDCVANGCCAVPGSPCRTSSECCGDAVCNDSGMCEMPGMDCGAERADCCDGDTCRSGLECVEGTCIPCGDDGQSCCRPPDECMAGLVCTAGSCHTPTGDCGEETQPCCDGTSCTSGLECNTAGVCVPPSETCSYTTCGACTGSATRNCGWCGGSDACMVGDASGPSGGSCASGWEFGAGSTCAADPDTCPSNTDCDSCTRDRSFVCGWCATAGSCHRGTSTGADDSTCSDPDWKWLSSECSAPMDSCGDNTDCAACTRDSSGVCGWCPGTSTCHRGTSTGTTDGSCSDPDWQWLSSECGGGADPCNALGVCTACTDLGDTLDCGWCADSSTCLSGDASGPTTGSCSDWRRASCTGICQEVTDSCTMDTDCCRTLSCRRGVSFSARCCVESFGICAFGSDCCGSMSCVTGFCQCRGDSAFCIDDRDCCSSDCNIPSGGTSGACVGS